jgi:hypothetical protein
VCAIDADFKSFFYITHEGGRGEESMKEYLTHRERERERERENGEIYSERG